MTCMPYREIGKRPKPKEDFRMKKIDIPIEQFHIMRNSYGRLCLAHGGFLLGKLGDIDFFESAIMNNFHPVYDKENNIINIVNKKND